MLYKVSQFNYITQKDENTIRLYNTLRGKNSLLEIRSSVQKALNLLRNQTPIDIDFSDFLHLTLVNKGYLIPLDTDEKRLRNFKHLDTVHSHNLTLMLIPTEKCNFRCEYCNQWHKDTFYTPKMQDSIIKYIRKNILSFCGVSIAWFGGEPLQAKDIVLYMSEKIQDICKVAKRSYLGSITSNGYDLTPEVFVQLYNLGIRSFQITLDGFSETHDKFRHLEDGSGSFEKIIENLLSIKQMKLNHFNIAIRTNYTADIFKRAPEFITFLRDNFKNDSRFSVSIQMASDWGGNISNDTKKSLVDLSTYAKIVDLYRIYGQDLDYSFELNSISTEIGLCYVNSRNFYGIKPDGTIIKCTQNLNDPSCYIGQVKDNGHFEIDENKQADWFFSANTTNMCDNCAYGGICFGSSCPMKNRTNQMHSNCPRNKLFCEKILNLFPDNYFYIFQER